MNTFVGRTEETKLLEDQIKKKSASVMIYGKRKVGKTTLINHVLEKSDFPTVYYECIKAPISQNVAGLTNELVRVGILPAALPFDNFVSLFAYLNSTKTPLNVVIDEYPYIKEAVNAEVLDSELQSVIDNYIENIHLFISGSHIGMMKNLLYEKNALYGRFSLVLQLKELNYREASLFYSQKNSYDKVAFYSIFGGSPFVNSFIDRKASLRTNIINTLLNESSPVFVYANYLLLSDFSKQANAERIIYSISNGKKKYKEIESFLGLNKNGNLSKQIDLLLEMEILSKIFPINKTRDKKKVFYETSDNVLRFYFSFVYKNKSSLAVLGAEAFYDEYVAPTIKTFVSHRFEDICREYFSLKVKSGKLRGVKNIGVYYYDDCASGTHGEFDVALERKNSYEIYEAKYLEGILHKKDVEIEVSQIKNIKNLIVGKIGFVSVNGFEKNISGYELISGKDLYEKF